MNIIPLAFAALLSFAVGAQDSGRLAGLKMLHPEGVIEVTETGTADVTWVDRGGWVRYSEETTYRLVWAESANPNAMYVRPPREIGKWSYPRIPRNAKILDVANVRAVSTTRKELTE